MHRRRCVLKMIGRRTTKEGIEGLSDGRTEDGYEKSRRRITKELLKDRRTIREEDRRTIREEEDCEMIVKLS
jgi:hypothetical protein